MSARIQFITEQEFNYTEVGAKFEIKTNISIVRKISNISIFNSALFVC